MFTFTIATFVSCANHKIELNMLFCTPLDHSEISICSGRLIANPEDSSFSINARFGNSDRPHRLTDLPEQFSPAAALLVSSTEM